MCTTDRVGPKVVRGEKKPNEPIAKKLESQRSGFMRAMSDSGLKPTVVYHNLTPAELYEKVCFHSTAWSAPCSREAESCALSVQALQHEPGTSITSAGALATLSGAKTGRSPRDKRVVREADSEQDIWWNNAKNGSPNFEMDER